MSAKAELAPSVSMPSDVIKPIDDSSANWSPREKDKKQTRRSASPEALPYAVQQLIDLLRPDLQLNRGGLAQTKEQKGQAKAVGDDGINGGKTVATSHAESQSADHSIRAATLGRSTAGQQTVATASAAPAPSGQVSQSDKNRRQSAAVEGQTTQPQGHSAMTSPVNADLPQVATPAP